MHARLFQTRLFGSRLGAAACCSLALMFAAMHAGGWIADSHASFDAVWAGIDALLAPDPADPVDLNDGRSPVAVQWQSRFERFAAEERAHAPVAGGVVFVGSSSIEYWRELQAQFPDRHVTQRGLGGATMADCARHVDRLVLPYKPHTVVVYAGDNDLAAGTTPERIVADLADFTARIHRALPDTRIVVVSVKPSPSRSALLSKIERTNALMAAYTRTDRRLDFVDVFHAMLNRDGHIRRELFLPDALHMTAAGYALWRDALVAHL